MDATDLLVNAIVILVGALIVYTLIQVLSNSIPEFFEYGWLMMVAYVAGALIFLRFSQRSPKSRARNE